MPEGTNTSAIVGATGADLTRSQEPGAPEALEGDEADDEGGEVEFLPPEDEIVSTAPAVVSDAVEPIASIPPESAYSTDPPLEVTPEPEQPLELPPLQVTPEPASPVESPPPQQPTVENDALASDVVERREPSDPFER